MIFALVGVVAVVGLRLALDAGDGEGDGASSRPPATPSVESASKADAASRQGDRTCSLDPTTLEEATGFEEVVESIDCVYHVGYIRPGENAEAQCRGVLSDARALESNVAMVKIKDRAGETHADCR